MKIAVLGTGMVGESLATRLAELGHQVTMGARSAANEKAGAWAKKAGGAAADFAGAASGAEVVFNCTKGDASLQALAAAGAANLRGKVLVDVSNPLDFSKGMPPTLTVANTDSLGEQIQAAFPETKVVKALNTLTAPLMGNPRALPEDHTVFVAGNDGSAKEAVHGLLREFGWKDAEIVDAGDITAARGLEAWLLLWTRLYGALGTSMFNLRLVRAD